MRLPLRQVETQTVFGHAVTLDALRNEVVRRRCRTRATAPGDEREAHPERDAVDEADVSRDVQRDGLRGMGVLADGSRQSGIHEMCPYELARRSPKSARSGGRVRRHMGGGSDRDQTGPIVTGLAIAKSRKRHPRSWASSSVVTVTVTSERRVESVGEDAEEASSTRVIRSG